MSYQDICIQLNDDIEYEYSTRIEELQFFENCLELSQICEDDKSNTRKMLIVMAYAYFEGFCKHALLIYADYINRQHLLVNQVKPSIAATSAQHDFNLLENQGHKPIDIRGTRIKDDSKLFKLSRRADFISKYRSIMELQVNIDDKTLDTESNLKSSVLKGLLFKLDLDYTIVDSFQSKLNSLIGKRNGIAHGEITRGITKDDYKSYRQNLIDLMDILKSTISTSFQNKEYLLST